MTEPRRLTSPEKREDDAEASLRPLALADFIGQRAARANLQVFIDAAKTRGEALDHVLFVGPPGLGKTTLAQIVARELGVNFRSTSGPVIAKAGDLAALLTNLEERDVLFIDEIHRLNPAVEEILYPAMEDYQLDLIIGEGPAARSVKIELPKFTLVGATTRAGLLTTPLRDRFGIPIRLEFYTVDELERDRAARRAGARHRHERGRRQRDRPPLARHAAHRRPPAAPGARFRHRRRARPRSTRELADGALRLLDVDPIGLDQMDRKYLTTIAAFLRRRPGRHRDDRRRPLRAARRHRGDHRALPDPEGLRAAHAARPRAHPPRLPPPRPARADAATRRSSGCSTEGARMSEPRRRLWPLRIPALTVVLIALALTSFSYGSYLIQGADRMPAYSDADAAMRLRVLQPPRDSDEREAFTQTSFKDMDALRTPKWRIHDRGMALVSSRSVCS